MATPEQWPKVKEIVAEALEKDSDARQAFLDEVCSQDPSLRAEVESLIAAYGDANGLSQYLRTLPPVEVPEQSSNVGPYRLIRELGVGGMFSTRMTKTALAAEVNSVTVRRSRITHWRLFARTVFVLHRIHVRTTSLGSPGPCAGGGGPPLDFGIGFRFRVLGRGAGRSTGRTAAIARRRAVSMQIVWRAAPSRLKQGWPLGAVNRIPLLPHPIFRPLQPLGSAA